MSHKTKLKLFEDKSVRTHWDEELEKWYFSVVDVIGYWLRMHDLESTGVTYNQS